MTAQKLQTNVSAKKNLKDFLINDLKQTHRQSKRRVRKSVIHRTVVPISAGTVEATQHGYSPCYVEHAITGKRWCLINNILRADDSSRLNFTLHCWEFTSTILIGAKAYIFGKTSNNGETLYVTFDGQDKPFVFKTSPTSPENVDIENGLNGTERDPRIFYYISDGSSSFLTPAVQRNLYARLTQNHPRRVIASSEGDNWFVSTI